jgi:uncharacterized protein (TIGR03085 family)
VSSPAAVERVLLCDLFAEVGPDAPTLCGDWTARDLAAHLVVRERRPDAGPGIVASPLAGYTEHVRAGEAERPFTEIVDRLRQGPPRWSPMRVGAVDRIFNTVEFFVHHEDVRRARQPWTPRPLDDALTAALTAAVSGPMGRALVRSCPVGLAIEPDGAAGVRLRKGEPTVAVAGPIGEIVLFLYGRAAVAGVDLDGDPDAVAAVRAAEFGL